MLVYSKSKQKNTITLNSKLYLFILFVTVFFKSFSQEADSLLFELDKTDNPNHKAEILLHISAKIQGSYPDSAYNFVSKAMEIGEEANDLLLITRAYKQFGLISFFKGDYDKASRYFKKALTIANDNKFQKQLPGLLLNMGSTLSTKRDDENAIKYYHKCIKVSKDENNTKTLYIAYHNIGTVLHSQGRYKEALAYYINSFKIKNEQSGLVCINIASIYQKINVLDSAFYYVNLSLDFADKYNNKYNRAQAYNLLGDLYRDNNIDLSKDYYLKAIDIFNELNNKNESVKSYLSLANLYNDSYKNVTEAEYYYKKAEEAVAIGGETTNSNLPKIYFRLGQLYNKQHRYKLANKYLLKKIELDKKNYKIEKEQAIAEIQAKYDIAKKDKEIADNQNEFNKKEITLRKKKYYYTISTIFLGFLMLLFYITYRKEKYKNTLLKKDKVLQNISLENKLQEERIRISQDLHDNLGAHLSFIISSIDNILFFPNMPQEKILSKIKNIKEFAENTISHFRDTIWALNDDNFSVANFSNRLKIFIKNVENSQNHRVKIDITDSIKDDIRLNPTQTINLYRVIQEAINNAVKYAETDRITIAFKQDNNLLVVSIKDFGIGFDQKEITDGYGINNMKRRINKINGEIQINSDNGTEIIISIPLHNS